MSTATPPTKRDDLRLRSLFARPVDSIEAYLAPGERVLHIDAPALNAFFVEELPTILITSIAGIGAVVWGTSTGNLFIAGAAMIGAGSVLLYMRAKRWTQQYTAYVLTTTRVMKVSGFLRRTSAWIPWVKVTDIRFEASLMGRVLGYATVFIDSANETSGLAEMKNLRDPNGFYIMLTELVQLRQGSLTTTPVVLHE